MWSIAGPTLLLWGPSPPTGEATPQQRAQHAAAAYADRAKVLLAGAAWRSPGGLGKLRGAMDSFMRRWLSAAKAAAGSIQQARHRSSVGLV